MKKIILLSILFLFFGAISLNASIVTKNAYNDGVTITKTDVTNQFQAEKGKPFKLFKKVKNRFMPQITKIQNFVKQTVGLPLPILLIVIGLIFVLVGSLMVSGGIFHTIGGILILIGLILLLLKYI